MIAPRTDRVRPRPSGPAQVFVIYDRKTGAIVGAHHVLNPGAQPSGTLLTTEKQRAAAKALDEALLQRAAATAGVPASRVALLRMRAPLGDLSQMRVRRGRLVRAPAPPGGPRLSSLARQRRPRPR